MYKPSRRGGEIIRIPENTSATKKNSTELPPFPHKLGA